MKSVFFFLAPFKVEFRMLVFSLYFPLGFESYRGCFPIPGQDFRPPLPRVLPLPDLPPWTQAHPAPLAAQRKVIPCHPGIRLACGPGWRQFAATASSQLVSPKGEERFLCHPDIALVCGQEERRGPCKAGMSLVCGQGWRGPPCCAGTDQVGAQKQTINRDQL